MSNLETLRHSAAHVLAMAVKKHNPKAKLAIGPAIENGFYYDFDNLNITENSLKTLTASMKKIIKQKLAFKKEIISKDKANKLFKGEPYKLELIEELSKISIYHTGDFIDLCAGPHVKNTSEIKAVKLLNIAGAYWKGDEKNKMLTRIYGTAFASKKELKNYLEKLEAAQSRDHVKLGKQLDLFSLSSEVGAGLPLWHPKGAIVREVIEDFWKKEHVKRGYKYVYTPHIGKATLWKKSGHL